MIGGVVTREDIAAQRDASVREAPRGKLRAGIEAIVAGEEKRLSFELRYNFAGL